jgi:hypothetical protein
MIIPNIATADQIKQIAALFTCEVNEIEIEPLKRTHHGIDFARKNPMYDMKTENFTAIMEGENVSYLVRL